MKVNFSKVVLKTIEGEPIKGGETHKNIGNIIYQNARDLGLVTIAQEIYKGNEVDLSDAELKEIKNLINNPSTGLMAFARKAVLDYIDNIGKE